MRFFHNDYNELCHQSVMQRMLDLQNVQMDGYGMDTCCDHAAEMIRKLCGDEKLSVHFIPGGTQTNVTVLAASLRPHQAVIGADCAHIHVHETGALEGTGHKIIALPSVSGKISAEQINNIVTLHWNDDSHEHMAQPKMVYITNPTEMGTLYSLAELEAISAVCKEQNLFLFVDGARMGYGLMSEKNDI